MLGIKTARRVTEKRIVVPIRNAGNVAFIALCLAVIALCIALGSGAGR